MWNVHVSGMFMLIFCVNITAAVAKKTDFWMFFDPTEPSRGLD